MKNFISKHYLKMPEADLSTFAGRLFEYSSKEPTLKTLKSRYDAINGKNTAYRNALGLLPGTKDQTMDKNNKKAELLSEINKYAAEVEILANDDEQLGVKAGFEIRKEAVSFNGTIPPPRFKKVHNDINKSGKVIMLLEPVKEAIAYAISHSIDNGPWEQIDISSSSRMDFEGFKPGTYVRFQVEAVGRKRNKSEASEVGLWIS